MTMKELAERMDRARWWMFGRRWLLGPISLALLFSAAALRAIASQETTQ
jgi:hypothetical protein